MVVVLMFAGTPSRRVWVEPPKVEDKHRQVDKRRASVHLGAPVAAPPTRSVLHPLGSRRFQAKYTSPRHTSGVPRETNGERRPVEQELRVLYQAIAASGNGITISDPSQPDRPLIYVNRRVTTLT